MKSAFEKVVIDEKSSVALLDRRLADGIPFEWHHHPEFELTLTLNSRGHRFVGDHMGAYDDGDLVLVGPNLPHTWRSSDAIKASQPHVAIVSWFSEGWAGEVMRVMPELGGLAVLLKEARQGVLFSNEAARDVRPLIEGFPRDDTGPRLLNLLRVLRRLAEDDQRTLLAAPAMSPAPVAPDARLQRVLDHLHTAFDQPLDVDGLAEIACLSPSALHRMFRRHTRMTPITYVMRLRIGGACAMLMENRYNIADVAELVGYTNLANFNRQFRTIKGVTPREFRAQHRSKTPLNERRPPTAALGRA